MSSKLARSAQKIVVNQYMTKEAISSASFHPAETKTVHPPKINVRLHDESNHLKFGFPKSKAPVPNTDDNLQLNAEKLVKEEKDRQSEFSKLSTIRV